MKKIIRLNENDVRCLVKRCLMEAINYSKSCDKELELESDEEFDLNYGFIAKEVKHYIECLIGDISRDEVEKENDVTIKSFKVYVHYVNEMLLVIGGTYKYRSVYKPGNSYGIPEVCYEDEVESSVDSVSIDGVDIIFGNENREISLNDEDMRKVILPIEKEINNNIDWLQ